MRLAAERGGVVINADAMQVYRDLRVLTARPAPADEAAVPHRLFGHVDAALAHSVAAWLADAAEALAAVREAGLPAIVVGGTGLYLAALTEGIAPVPPVPEAVRAHWRERRETESSEALHAALAVRDPEMAARLRPTDPQRVLRALEVIDGTGRSLAEWQAERGEPLVPPETATRVVLAPPRGHLRETIARRFRTMMEEGAVEEAAALAARGLSPDLPAMKAIGVRPLAAYAAGELDRSAAVERAVTESRQYAKRQETWFRHRFADWDRAPDASAAAELLRSAGPAAPV